MNVKQRECIKAWIVKRKRHIARLKAELKAAEEQLEPKKQEKKGQKKGGARAASVKKSQ